MTRPVTARMAQALSEGWPRGIFVAIEHPDNTGRFHSGIGSRTWNGYTWRGAGPLGSVSPVKRSSEIGIQDITYSISGVDAAVAAGLNDNVRNLNGSVWLACFGPDDKVVADPYQLIDSELDYQTMERSDDGTVRISIIAHTGFYTLDKVTEEAWTPQNHKRDYPTSTGLDMIPSLQKQDLPWTPV